MKYIIGEIKCLVVVLVILMEPYSILAQSDYGDTLGFFYETAAISNGSYTGTGNGVWQCVEFVERYYNHAADWSGNVSDWFKDTEVEERKMNSHKNGGPVPPIPGNVLVWEGGKFGHISLVKSIDFANQKIRLIDQNRSIDPEAELSFIVVTEGEERIYTFESNPTGLGTSYSLRGWLSVKVGQYHNGMVEHAVLDKYNSLDEKRGGPFDNGEGPYLHKWHSQSNPDIYVWIQDFYQPDSILDQYGDDGQYAIILNDNTVNSSAYVVRDGFWGHYKTHDGFRNYGSPIEDESAGVQRFVKYDGTPRGI